jgi:hypothetical protein
VHNTLPEEEGDGTKVQATTRYPPILKISNQNPPTPPHPNSLAGGNPVIYLFNFMCTLFVARKFYFILPTVVFNKVPNFTHMYVIKLIKHME